MSDAALFGGADDDAHLDGFGPIPAELAREIVAGACEQGEEVWLHRLYTSPTTGELVAMDAHGRHFRGSLGRFVRLRDRVCRTPWCDAPIRHHRPRTTPRRRRSHQRRERAGPVRGLQLRQGLPRLAGQTRPRRDRGDHHPDRPPLLHPTTTGRPDPRAGPPGTDDRLRPRGLTARERVRGVSLSRDTSRPRRPCKKSCCS